MPDKYISVEAFTASMQERYCKNCDRRKGMKNGKLKTIYAIGDAPCRSCGIDDMLDDIDAYPPADVVSRDCFNRILAENDKLREENKKLRVDLASAKAEFENYKSWERDYENGQVQGMW